MKHKSMNFNDINIEKLNHRKEVMKAGAHIGSDVKSDVFSRHVLLDPMFITSFTLKSASVGSKISKLLIQN